MDPPGPRTLARIRALVEGAGRRTAARAYGWAAAGRRRWPLSRPATAGTALAALAIVMLLWARCGVRGCPDVDRLASYQPGGAPVLLDRGGERFADLAPFRRDVVPLSDLPNHVPAAFLAVEDKRFYEHRGVDWLRVAGAALANVKAGELTQGSSTITMQLARSVFPDRLPGQERTFRRKLLEVRVAGAIEDRFEKDEIIELYLNHIYFGNGVYGIEAASRHYFGDAAADLSLAEAATLAGLVRAPARYDPRRHPERGRERRDLVIGLMEEQGRVDAEAAAEAREASPDLAPRRRAGAEREPFADWFIDVVRSQLEERFGSELYSSRLRIATTLDPIAQHALEEELGRQLTALDGGAPPSSPDDERGSRRLQGAGVLMEVATGDVLALVGGRDYVESTYNRALLARRQLGSTFKPFVYLAALSGGIAASQRLLDAPLRVELSGDDVWEPRNYDGRFRGPVSVREALVQSRNVPTVRLAQAVGIERVVDAARSAGLRGDLPETPAVALGSAAATPLELTVAFTPLASLGLRVSPRLVSRVLDDEGEVLWEPEVRREEALDPAVAYIVTDILREAVERGTGRAVRQVGFRGPAAGKTGTTSDAHDVWFVGYTPDLVGTVWMGYDTPRPLGSRGTGGAMAAPVWGRVMRRVYAEREMPSGWAPPAGVLLRPIDRASGLVLADRCVGWGAERELFLEEHLPAEVCPERRLPGRGRLATVADALAERLGALFGRDPDDPDLRRATEEIERQLGAGRLPSRGDRRALERYLERLGRDVRITADPASGRVRVEIGEERGRGRGERGRGNRDRPE